MKFSYLSGSLGAPTRYSLEPYKSKTKFVVVALLCCLIAFSLSAYQLFSSDQSVVRASSSASLSTNNTATLKPQIKEVTEAPKPLPQFDDKKIAEALNLWTSENKGNYSVAVSDEDGKIIAQYSSDQQYFMASIYKLYVAYIAYQKVDQGKFRLDEPYLDGWTRGKCLDEMIRTSHNACGEKMLVELGSDLKNKLSEYGLSGTSVSAFTTSAVDASKILVLIKKGANLSQASQAKLLDSMLGQKYRQGLPDGFATSKVFDKVGFRGNQEYHDVGIVELSDGRTLIVSVFSDGVGVTKIAELSADLFAASQID